MWREGTPAARCVCPCTGWPSNAEAIQRQNGGRCPLLPRGCQPSASLAAGCAQPACPPLARPLPVQRADCGQPAAARRRGAQSGHEHAAAVSAARHGPTRPGVLHACCCHIWYASLVNTVAHKKGAGRSATPGLAVPRGQEGHAAVQAAGCTCLGASAAGSQAALAVCAEHAVLLLRPTQRRLPSLRHILRTGHHHLHAHTAGLSTQKLAPPHFATRSCQPARQQGVQASLAGKQASGAACRRCVWQHPPGRPL